MSLATQSKARFFIQFGGQGTSYLLEMRKLYKNYPELGEFFQTCFEALEEGIGWMEEDRDEILTQGFALKDWLDEKNVPDMDYLNTCTISLPSTEITQLAYYNLLNHQGYSPEKLLPHTAGMTGHSQGVLAAVLSAMDLKGDEYHLGLRRHVQFLLMGGYRCQQTFPLREIPAEVRAKAMELDEEPPSPMVSLGSIERPYLQAKLDEFNPGIPPERAITISLYNGPDSMVMSGDPEHLVAFREKYKAEFDEQNVKWAYLEISAPFHSHIMPAGVVGFRRDLKKMGYNYRGSDLKLPVYSTDDGKNLQEMDELGEFLFLLQSSTPLDWPKSVASAINDNTITHIIDCGPSRISALMTKQLLKGKPVEIFTAASKQGLRKLLEVPE